MDGWSPRMKTRTTCMISLFHATPGCNREKLIKCSTSICGTLLNQSVPQINEEGGFHAGIFAQQAHLQQVLIGQRPALVCDAHISCAGIWNWQFLLIFSKSVENVLEIYPTSGIFSRVLWFVTASSTSRICLWMLRRVWKHFLAHFISTEAIRLIKTLRTSSDKST